MFLLGVVSGMERKEVYDFIQMVAKYSRNIKSNYVFEDSYSKSNNPFRMLGSLRGTENVYTQHKPFVTKEILPELVKGRQHVDLNYLSSNGQHDFNHQDSGQPRKIILFFIGGFTYEECKAVYEANRQFKGCNAVVGGTSLLTYDSYLEEIKAACRNR